MIDKILKRITPSVEKKRAMEKICKELIEDVERAFSKSYKDFDVHIYGSISRDTWLSDEKDIDLFVRFPPSHSKKELEDAVTAVGKKVLKRVEKRFAEHPYVKGEYDGHNVEIVPCYFVSHPSKRLSAVDRTPFHDEFVRKNLLGREKEVRLLKQFLKGIGCYGAEAKIMGFSGYLCELLIIQFGSFERLLKEAALWTPPIVLDTMGKADTGGFQPSPLIVVDPTDRERNVASALSAQNLSLFIYASKEFLKSKKETYFFPKKRMVSRKSILAKYKARSTHLVSLTFDTPDVIEDTVYTQIRKAIRLLEGLLSESGFSIMNAGFYVSEKVTVVFELQSLFLPAVKTHRGPIINSKNESEFLKKHRGSKRALSAPFIVGNRWMVYVKRENINAEAFLKSFLSKKGLRKKGVPSHIAASIERGFETSTGEDAIKGDLGFYADLLDPRFPWEID